MRDDAPPRQRRAFPKSLSARVVIIISLLGILALLLKLQPNAMAGPSDGRATELKSPAVAPILLFNGIGTSPNDVTAVAAVLDKAGLGYSTINSAQLNELNAATLGKYDLLIVPGGNFIQIGEGLTSTTTSKVRGAVENGMNYFGICAGAFFGGNSPYNGLDLTSGVRFGFYSISAQGVRKAAVPISMPGQPTFEHYWEDGPQFTGWGEVAGKYPDGTPAIVVGRFGEGRVLLLGTHPEAPESWRGGMEFKTPAAVSNDLAAKLVRAALDRQQLRHY